MKYAIMTGLLLMVSCKEAPMRAQTHEQEAQKLTSDPNTTSTDTKSLLDQIDIHALKVRWIEMGDSQGVKVPTVDQNFEGLIARLKANPSLALDESFKKESSKMIRDLFNRVPLEEKLLIEQVLILKNIDEAKN